MNHRQLAAWIVVGFTGLPQILVPGPTSPPAAVTVARVRPTSPVSPVAPRTAPRSCTQLAASLTLDQQIGQLLMVGISSGGLTDSQARILARGHVGSVILLGNSTAGRRSVKRLSTRVHHVGGRPRGVAVMLTVDQEGGKVQRLRGSGFDRIPSAKSQSHLSSATLTRRAKRWALQLRAAGVDANLAPVADVVPKKLERVNQPIGLLQRGYGPDPDVVAAKVPAFVRGMHQGGIASAVKHFPGLGRVRGNTDYTSRVVDRTTKRHDRALKGFAAGGKAGVDMVMMSSAYYTRIDPKHRAAFSTTIIGTLVRKDLGFTGVVISDDLGTRALHKVPVGQRATSFLRAGGDLIIVGNPKLAPAMIRAIRTRAKGDPKFRAGLRGKATRVLQMKARRGLTRCG